VRRLEVTSALAGTELRAALEERGPLLLELRSAPEAVSRAELLGAAARAEALILARFDGTLATPLAELALLAHAGEFGSDARLDLSDSLLAPLVFRVGFAEARRILARGLTMAAADVVPRFGGSRGRSADAVRIAEGLLAGTGSPRELLAAERAAFALVMALPDRSEGLLAFRQKRAPAFDW